MQIKDIGIIISKRPLQEKSGIITVFTKKHGIYSGFVRNIFGKESITYQLGNMVDVLWNARLNEHIGTMKCELVSSSSHFMYNTKNLYALNSLFSMVSISFEERVPHETFFAILHKYLSDNPKKFSFMEYAHLENSILREVGYGLDLDTCVVTGQSHDLSYVSPKSGRAVSLSAGEQYKDKLLKLPQCFLLKTEPTELVEVEQISKTLIYFFQRYVCGKHEPETRKIFMRYVYDNL